MSAVANAEMRREVRRQRILQNSERRINAILGAEGDRKEPALEGGPIGKIPFASLVPPPAAAQTLAPTEEVDAADDEDQQETSPTPQEGSPTGTLCSSGATIASDQLLSPDSRLKSAVGSTDVAGPSKVNQRIRVVVALLLGVLMRLPWASAVNVSGVWLIYQLSWELIYLSMRKAGAYPQHGHIVDFLMSFGFDQRLVICSGYVTDVATRFLNDTVSMLIAFFVTDRLLVILM